MYTNFKRKIFTDIVLQKNTISVRHCMRRVVCLQIDLDNICSPCVAEKNTINVGWI